MAALQVSVRRDRVTQTRGRISGRGDHPGDCSSHVVGTSLVETLGLRSPMVAGMSLYGSCNTIPGVPSRGRCARPGGTGSPLRRHRAGYDRCTDETPGTM